MAESEKKVTKMSVAERVVATFDANEDKVDKTKVVIAAISEELDSTMAMASTYYYLIRKRQRDEAEQVKRDTYNARRRAQRAAAKAAASEVPETAAEVAEVTETAEAE